MNALIILLALIMCIAVSLAIPVEGPAALLVCLALTVAVGMLLLRTGNNKGFLIRLFISALLVRLLIGSIIFILHLQNFFGGDANTYDFFGYALLKGWQGDKYFRAMAMNFGGETGASGWGMTYMVAGIYRIAGRNMLATQFVNGVLGAATAPVIFLCAQHIFNNVRVARVSGILVAFYPSLVLWSSQGLKDGPIVFALSVSIFAALKLKDRFSLKYLALLSIALIALLSLRFYIFYMMVAAISGAFIIGMRQVSAQSFIRQFAVIIVVGLALAYFGVSRYASSQIGTYANLEAVQRSRSDLAQSGKSGFGRDVDVSTGSGALSALPTGVVYLLFAPFPWQLTTLRQSITLPEMVVWWCSFPLLMLGLWFTVTYRLREISPILIFTSMLTLAYALFQGNVGTAYRQRSQLLIFYFIFVAVGYELLMERLENQKRQRLIAREEFAGKRLLL